MFANKGKWLSAWAVAGGVALGVLMGIGLVLACGCAGKAASSSLVAPSDAAESPAPSQAGGAGVEAEMVDQDAAGGVGAGEGEGEGEEEKKELSLAVYERLLVEQELRLRSAGVPMRGDLASATEDVDMPAKSGGDGRAKKAKNKAPTSTKDGGGDLAYNSQPKRGGGGAGAGAPAGDQSVSQRICELAESTCDLERQICRLAARHPDEERYAQVCERAGEDCQLARDACEARRVSAAAIDSERY